MVKWVAMVMDALRGGGVRARRGYPGEKYIRPEVPVAAVKIYSVEGQTVVVAAEVFAVRAEDCENTADTAIDALEAAGFTCTAGSCQFQEKMGLFSLRILVRRVEAAKLPCTFYLNKVEMPYVTAFSASSTAEVYQYTSEEGTTEILQGTKVWTLTVEELIPADVTPEEDSQESFSLAVQRDGGTEGYTACRWETVRREETAEGVRQVRIAKSWNDRMISE